MDNRLKILVLSDYAFIKGGAEKVAILSSIGLADRGHEVVFFSAVGPADPDLAESKIKKTIVLGQKDILDDPDRLKAMFSGIYNSEAIGGLRELLSGWRPDIVHMHGVSKALSWAPVRLCHDIGLPVIYTLHDYGMVCPNLGIYNFRTGKNCDLYCQGCTYRCLLTNCDKRNYGQKLWRWTRFFVNRKFLKLAGRISGYIAVSDFLKKTLEKTLTISAPMKTIYNPVENVRSPYLERGSRSGKGVTRFLYVGRLSPEKGVDMLLEAIMEIKGRLVIAGDGELRELCEKSSREAEEGKIEVMGYLDKKEIARQMALSDVLVLPSRCMEPAPLVIGEASYHRLPAIVAGHGGLKEFVKDGINGFYFKAGEMASLINIMRKAAADPGILEHMGDNALKSIRKKDPDIDTLSNKK